MREHAGVSRDTEGARHRPMNELRGSSHASGCRFAIVVSRFNEEITDGLLNGACQALTEASVRDEDMTVLRVPGAFDIPVAALRAAETGRFDAVICLGAVIKGETMHFEYIAGATSQADGCGCRRHRSADHARCADNAHRRSGQGARGPRGPAIRAARPRVRRSRWPRFSASYRKGLASDGHGGASSGASGEQGAAPPRA